MKTGKLWKALILAGIVGIAGGLAGYGGIPLRTDNRRCVS